VGRITKKIVIETGAGIELGDGVIDSGADHTTLKSSIACKLGLDPRSAPQASMESASDDVLVGHWMPVFVTIDRKQACVRAFVPVLKRTADGDEPFEIDENLVGSDFLQGSGAKLDYAQPHEETFSGLPKPSGRIGGGLFKYRPATPEESEALRRVRPCRRTRKRR
jgi:hypothetical protein